MTISTVHPAMNPTTDGRTGTDIPRPPAAARVYDAVKVYGRGENEVRALDGVSVEFATGRFTAIMGPSGSGKSTLMHSVAGLDHLTSGTVLIGDTDISKLDDRKLTQLRRDRIGFIFQAFNLVPTLTAAGEHRAPDRARRPQARRRVVRPRRRDRGAAEPPQAPAVGALRWPAAARRRRPRPRQPPEIIFADEPTGNLDSRTGAEILSFMRTAVREFGQTIVMVTHDPVAASYADRAVFLADGRIVDDLDAPTADSVIDRIRTSEADRHVHAHHQGARSRKLRLLTTAFAVLLGVAFMAGTLVFTDTIGATYDSALAEANEGSTPTSGRRRRSTSATASPARASTPRSPRPSPAVDGVDDVALRINGYAQLVGPDGEPVGDIAKNPGVRHQLGDGRRPQPVRAGERHAPAATTRSSSTRRAPTRPATSRATSRPCSPSASRGSSRSPASPRSAPPTPRPGRRRCCSPTPRPPSCWPSPARPTRSPSRPTQGCRRPTSPLRIQAAVGDDVEVITGATLVAEDQAADGRAARRMGTIIVVFAVVAVFVGAFIINNTFSITVAQRTREMAMLRAIGASGPPGEALGAHRGRRRRRVGVGRPASSPASVWPPGSAADVGVRVRHARRPDGHQPSAMILSFAVGVIVTVLSAWLPARRAARIAPIAALRDVSVDRSAGSARRAVAGSASPPWVSALLAGLGGEIASSVSVRWRRSSAWPCSVRCSPARSPRCSACRCGCVGSAVSSPPATRCGTRSGPPARRRR